MLLHNHTNYAKFNSLHVKQKIWWYIENYFETKGAGFLKLNSGGMESFHFLEMKARTLWKLEMKGGQGLFKVEKWGHRLFDFLKVGARLFIET